MTSNEIEALMRRGAACCRAKEYDAAIADFTKIIGANPKIAAAWYNRGCAWHGKGNKTRAIIDFETAVELVPDNARYRETLEKMRGNRRADAPLTGNDGDLFLSNFESGGAVDKRIDKIIENPFFSFSRPYLDFIGKGKFLNLVYFIMAGINALLPFAIIFKANDSNVFQYAGYVGAKYIIAIVLAWLVVAFACWIGFQLWLYRRKKIAAIITVSSEFIATLIFSELVQTFGEWLGTFIGITGAGVGLIAAIFFGEEANSLFSMLGMNFMRFGGAKVIIVGPVTGFFIIIGFRFIAEQFRLKAALVNNTKEIAVNIKSGAHGA